MKKLSSLLIGGTLLVLASTSCQQPKPMDDAAIAALADSTFKAQMTGVMDSMKMDCQTNMAAWVQAKADSISAAAMSTK